MGRWLWTQVADIGPRFRFQHAMAYDEARDRVVLFGGRTTGAPGEELRPSDTWEWDGDAWAQVKDSGPSGRAEFAMAYDANRRRVVLFGGATLGAGLLNDTWEWDGHFWTQVEDSGPPPMGGHTMTFDRPSKRIILHQTTTWAWDGMRWVELAETPPPAPFGIVAFDDARAYTMLLEDGLPDSTGKGWKASRTLKWDGTFWKPLSDMGPISHVPDSCVASDGKRLVAYLSGSRETWEWDGVHWIQRQDMGPSTRLSTSMVGDTARNQCLLFGGNNLGDTWILSVKED